MANLTKLTTRAFNGIEVEIMIDTNGSFHATIDTIAYQAESLEKLSERLEYATKTKKVKVAIEFHRWKEAGRYSQEAGKLAHGVITGIHAANGNLIVKFDGEKGIEQEYRSHLYLKLNDEQQAEYVRMQRALRAAQTELEKFEKKHGFDGIDAVNKALAVNKPA